LVLLIASAVVVPACTAEAATINGCVKKKTGELRIRSSAKKKCPKGWKKIKWNTAGAVGKQGPPGTNGTNGVNGLPGPVINVNDASGAIVGQLLGVVPEGGAIYFVLRDGGLFFYLGSGQLFSLSQSPDWKTSDCSGTAYVRGSSSVTADTLAKLVGGLYRVVFRTNSAGTFGPPTAWKGHGTTESVVSTQLYERNSTTGVCQTDGAPFTGDLALLDEVPAPPDFTGPLTIG
jgi:hypothetical protein